MNQPEELKQTFVRRKEKTRRWRYSYVKVGMR